jgi:hypothetical protein
MMLTKNQKYKIKILPKKELKNNEEMLKLTDIQYNKNIVDGKGINEMIE